MNQGFGSELPRAHQAGGRRKAGRYLVIIDSGGMGVARLFDEGRRQLEEFDAGAAEVAWFRAGREPGRGAEGPEWDGALVGHSAAERAAAAVYTLEP